LAVFDGLGVFDEDALDGTGDFGLDLVHHLHGLDDAYGLTGFHGVALGHEGVCGRGGGTVEGADHGSYEELLSFPEGDAVAVYGAVTNEVDGAVSGGLGEGSRGGIDGGYVGSRGSDRRACLRAALDDDAHLAALDVELAHIGGGDETHKLFDLGAERGEGGAAINLGLRLLFFVVPFVGKPYHARYLA
jgi:hypothetical protein